MIFQTTQRYLFTTLTVFFLSVLFAGIAPAKEPDSQDIHHAKAFIQSMGDEVIDYISDPALSAKERKKKLDAVLRRNFDTDTISRFTLGPYWLPLTQAQQKEFQTLYQDMIVAIYADKFSDYNGEQFVVGKAGARGEKDFIVKSRIIRPEAKNIDVNWQIRLKNGSYKIIDVTIEDVSMIITQKSDFSSIIQREGGNATAIIEYLRNRKR